MKIEINPIPFLLGFVFCLGAFLLSGSLKIALWVLFGWLCFVVLITILLLAIGR